MENKPVCRSCGRTVQPDFAFCPWCGESVTSPEMLSSQLDTVFEQVELKQKEYTVSRIQRMENTLGELELALSRILARPDRR
jgi:uncharacterized OB-fold protein